MHVCRYMHAMVHVWRTEANYSDRFSSTFMRVLGIKFGLSGMHGKCFHLLVNLVRPYLVPL